MKTPTVITLTATATTGAVQEILPMSENGGPGALFIPVPSGSFLEIDDYDVSAGGAPGEFKLQQTNDGSNWFTIGNLQVIGQGLGAFRQVNPKTPWCVHGGPSVAIRIAITTPGGALPVASVLNGYRVTP